MTRINLLPWREQLREKRKNDFYILLGVTALAAIFMMLLSHFIIGTRISNQESRNRFLQTEIKVLDRRIFQIKALQKKKEQILARINVIQDLQISRPNSVRFFDEIIKIIPNGIHLEQIKRINKKVILKGKADSNMSISVLMRRIEASHLVDQAHLHLIKTQRINGVQVSDFELNMTQLVKEASTL